MLWSVSRRSLGEAWVASRGWVVRVRDWGGYWFGYWIWGLAANIYNSDWCFNMMKGIGLMKFLLVIIHADVDDGIGADAVFHVKRKTNGPARLRADPSAAASLVGTCRNFRSPSTCQDLWASFHNIIRLRMQCNVMRSIVLMRRWERSNAIFWVKSGLDCIAARLIPRVFGEGKVAILGQTHTQYMHTIPQLEADYVCRVCPARIGLATDLGETRRLPSRARCRGCTRVWSAAANMVRCKQMRLHLSKEGTRYTHRDTRKQRGIQLDECGVRMSDPPFWCRCCGRRSPTSRWGGQESDLKANGSNGWCTTLSFDALDIQSKGAVANDAQ